MVYVVQSGGGIQVMDVLVCGVYNFHSTRCAFRLGIDGTGEAVYILGYFG